MIIFLYGQDTYRSRQKLNEIIDHYKKIHKDGLNLKYFDFKKENYEDFREEFSSFSMFPGKKLLVFKNAISNENFKLNFLKNPKKFLNSKEIILFYEEIEVSKEDKLFKFLKESGKYQEFKNLEGKSLENWAKKEFEKLGAKIENQTLKKIINFVGNDLWQLSNEIKKLVSYKNNEKIEARDVEILIRPKIEPDIFETIDFLAGKDKKRALSLIHQHLEKGDSPLYLLSMINFQFRNLLMVKSHGLGHASLRSNDKERSDWFALYANSMRILSKKFGLHPFVVKKTIQQARKFSFEELKKIYQKIFQTDLAIKTGKLDPMTALDILIAEI